MMTRCRILTLAVLAAFGAAQVESLNHRARHAAEEAAETEASLCLCGGEAVHLCADHAEDAHPPDCAVCVGGTILTPPADSGPVRLAPAVQRAFCSLDQSVPFTAPDAGLCDPRGPPAL